MTDDPKIARAEAKVDEARQRLVDTVQEISRHLEPRRLLGDLWEDAKIKGADLAEDAVDAVKARPLAATGAVSAIAMFLAREPIKDMVSKIAHGFGKKRADKKRAREAAAKPAPSKRAPPKPQARKPARTTRSKKVENAK